MGIAKKLSPIAALALSGSVLAAWGPATMAASHHAAGTSNKTLKIIMWVNPPAVAAVNKIDAAFQKKYGVKVQLETAANDQAGYGALQQTAVQGGTADIMAIEPFDPMPYKQNTTTLSSVQEWAEHGVFAPLNGQSYLSHFSKTDLGAAAYKGKDYGLVTGVYQTGLFYNKAIFAKYHLAVPSTYNQFVQLSKKLKSHGVTPVWTGIGNGATFYLEFAMFPLMLDQLPQYSVSSALASGKLKWTNPAMITTFAHERAFFSNDVEKNFAGQNWQQMPGDFAAGKAAMLLDGSWDLPSVLKANPHMKIGFFPFPGSNKAANNQPVANPDLTWTVLNNSKNKGLAEKWLAFFASKPEYSQYVSMTGISPSEMGSYHNQDATIMGKWFGVGRVIQQSPNFLVASGPNYLQPTNFWSEQLNMVQGQVSPKALAKVYQSAQQQALK